MKKGENKRKKKKRKEKKKTKIEWKNILKYTLKCLLYFQNIYFLFFFLIKCLMFHLFFLFLDSVKDTRWNPFVILENVKTLISNIKTIGKYFGICEMSKLMLKRQNCGKSFQPIKYDQMI